MRTRECSSRQVNSHLEFQFEINMRMKKILKVNIYLIILISFIIHPFVNIGKNNAYGYDDSVYALVDNVNSNRLLSTLNYLTSYNSRASYEAQEAVLNWIKTNLDAAGANTRLHEYEYNGLTWHNLVATIPGNASLDPGEAHLVVGAHIDSVPGSPGADDNASGVAAIMEAARVLANAQLDMRVDFIFFTNEEKGRVGSAAYASDAKTSGEDITAMIAVDMIAYGSAGEDLDLVTKPVYGWVADNFKEASDLYTTLASNVILDQSCG
jgi:Zn-dependent M28 family amino/carboxypeptidase